MLVVAGYDKHVKLIDVAEGKVTGEFNGHREWVLSTAFAPDGKSIATGSYDKTVGCVMTYIAEENHRTRDAMYWALCVVTMSPNH